MYYIGELYNKDDANVEELEGKVSDLEEERDWLEDKSDRLEDERDELIEDVAGFTLQINSLELYIDGFESGEICTRYDEDVDYTEL